MHLKHLKLAGFKSFVDVTTVYFPSQLVGVVGPNGCGKSNIVDAVRWVLGESSAKNLRGETMSDVIFNGSTQRKSIGQASVELIFDNSLGRLGGTFGHYAEISVKRLVTRDGSSGYFLNGSPCRRRDITDLFLGTGANARGYSIIGQGTISQLIEAKPIDLRIYLEEAAGVSKYKERRRETLTRIGHTQDNLARVNDICKELEKQVSRLEKQASAAERYLGLKKEENLCRGQILALKWRDLSCQRLVKQKELQALALEYEKQQGQIAALNLENISHNEKMQDLSNQLEQVQTAFYQLATEIARLEENIRQWEREKQQLERDCQHSEKDKIEAEQRQMLHQKTLENSCLQKIALEEKKQQVEQEFLQQEHDLEEKKQHQELWQTAWQNLQSKLNHTKQELQRTELKIDNHALQNQQIAMRLDTLHTADLAQEISEWENKLQQTQESILELCAQQETESALLLEMEKKAEELQQSRADLEKQLNQSHDYYKNSSATFAALTAAQNALIEKSPNQPLILHGKPRLVSSLQVSADWQLACEWVLQDLLSAVVLEDISEVVAAGMDMQGSAVVLHKRAEASSRYPSLADKISGDLPACFLSLESIYTVENLAAAWDLLPNLSRGESVITPQGFWLGQGWLRVFAPSGASQTGLLERQQKIAQSGEEIRKWEEKITLVRTQRDELHKQLQEQLNSIQQFRSKTSATREAHREQQNFFQTCQLRLQQNRERFDSQQQELESLQDQRMALSEQQFILQEEKARLQEEQENWLCELKTLDENKKFETESLGSAQRVLEDLQKVLYGIRLDCERENLKIQQYQERQQEEDQGIKKLEHSLQTMQSRLKNIDTPYQEAKQVLNLKLEQHHEIELCLSLHKEELSQLKLSQSDLECNRRDKEEKLKQTQNHLEKIKLEEQALATKSEGILEALHQAGFDKELLLAELSEAISVEAKEQALLTIVEEIQRLGAINLAAIEEYHSESSRKRHLEEQSRDLYEALASLNQAIDKMDKETRIRLEATFEAVNHSFQSLFPRLFGGGKAHLEWTCDNVLEAGIVVMAQPPGKRNSTIHLLSGGEKAMTAVALVFAIFQLNPSPFCMLDEVDAPLDEVNVGRFCDLVKEMSQYIQFLFITHNKVTMELADHLIGVTMREPGVSRLVAVDVQQALTLTME